MKVQIKYTGERAVIVGEDIALEKPRHKNDKRTHYKCLEKFTPGQVKEVPAEWAEKVTASDDRFEVIKVEKKEKGGK